MNEIYAQLTSEPALAWKTVVNLFGKQPASSAAVKAAETLRSSSLVLSLLKSRDTTGHAYRKWTGSHWILSILADLGYPAGEGSLRPMMEETFDCWLSEGHTRSVRQVAGRTRRCASQEGNAAWSSIKLGFADDRTAEFVDRLLQWQWPDGGWNCDKRPEADTSSFMETLIPLRALALYFKISGDPKVRQAAERAAEIFLKRQLYKRQRDDRLINEQFVKLHYPPYWHYDILFGLKVMAEAGFISDPRCQAALDLLEAKRLPDGGFPAEATYSRPTQPQVSGYTPILWGGTSKKKLNPFVTADALYVFRVAGRQPLGHLPGL
jgi:hypothetical protein